MDCEKKPEKKEIINTIIERKNCGKNVECMICPYWDDKHSTCKLIFAGAIFIKQMFGEK